MKNNIPILVILTLVIPLYAQQEPELGANAAAAPTTTDISVESQPSIAPVATPETPLQEETTSPAVSLPEQVTTPVSTQAEVTIPTQQEAPATKEVATSQVTQAPTASIPTVPAPVSPIPETPALPVEAEPSGATTDEDMEITGFDNVDLSEPKGNWLYKRIWWEKAERVYEKIKELTDKIIDLRSVFFIKRQELDHNVIDPFYFGLGIEQGELAEKISNFTQQLDIEEADEQPADQKERELHAMLAQEKKTLEQLQQQAQMISKIEQALDDALMKLIEQLHQARRYEQQAWAHFKAINRELSDKKARELYYAMDTFWKNLNNINTYLSDAYSRYYDQLTNKIQQETQNIKTTLQSLKEKGIDIQSPKVQKPSKSEDDDSENAEPEQETGFLGTVWKWIKSPFVFVKDSVSGLYHWIGGLFGGTVTQEEEATEQD